ncbi:hypothetical protein [Paenibacillus xylanexedens]|uniref:hypothetical protein n=1 Tax=Paenibacillus xylanexedens TaxID=528191 RepID=UPI000F53BF49|nr:hypothetical protein [Paenibacillus xylanexedens]RPK20049.1 hypothetical protein EDO6_06566 [Paenibacillus xylanexedens]
MHKTTLLGFDSLGIGPEIDMPNLAELLSMPTFVRAEIDDVYRLGGENLRKIIDSAPLTHSKKYYSVRVQMQFIKPGYCPVNTTEWHVDGHDVPVMHSGDITHLLVGDSSNLLTEFLENQIEVEEEFDVSRMGHRELMGYFESVQHKYGFKPKQIEPNRFVTMTCQHVHRVGVVEKPEFRFFFEIRESDYHKADRLANSRRWEQFVFQGNRGDKALCLEHSKQWGVIIRDKY